MQPAYVQECHGKKSVQPPSPYHEKPNKTKERYKKAMRKKPEKAKAVEALLSTAFDDDD
jgi:hypothetical protein